MVSYRAAEQRSLALVVVRISFALLTCLLSQQVIAQVVRAAPPGEPGVLVGRARSVILLIGDGVDHHQLTIARSYLLGADGSFSFERFDHQATAKVLTVHEHDPELPEYVADSASSGTAIAAGVITSRGRISTTAGADADVETILELAKTAGKRTGIVTTSSITDATPAVFAAHARMRFCEGPEDMAGGLSGARPGCPNDLRSKGGLGSIAEQLARSGVDVLLGGGYEHFDQDNENGDSLLDVARQEGYHLVRNDAELAAAKAGAKTLGLFGNDTLPVEWMGAGGRQAVPIQIEGDEVVAPEPFGCVDNPQFGERPTLQTMARKALEMLTGDGSDADPGFFLMIESASIDKQGHGANPCGQIGETKALDQAVQEAVDYQRDHPDTLILVTSDHGHAAQLIPWPSLFASLVKVIGRKQYPAGKVALLQTLEGGTMAVSYGTNKEFLEEHTGTTIPVFAQGPGATQVKGLLRQADVFTILRRAMGL